MYIDNFKYEEIEIDGVTYELYADEDINSISGKSLYKKGDLVGVKGRIQNNDYLDKDNNKKYTNEIIADKVSFLSKGKGTVEKSDEDLEM